MDYELVYFKPRSALLIIYHYERKITALNDAEFVIESCVKLYMNSISIRGCYYYLQVNTNIRMNILLCTWW